jgi:hypothetical protein
MTTNTLSYAELNWMVLALNHELVDLKREYDAAPEGSALESLAEMAIESRKNLVTKLTDFQHNRVKRITVLN